MYYSYRKRTDYLSWDDLFMAIASLTAKFGGYVGACIIDSDKKIVDIGYNGLLPRPKLNRDDVYFPISK